MPVADPRIRVILASPAMAEFHDRLSEHYLVQHAFTHEERMALAAREGAGIRGFIVQGSVTVQAELLDLLPDLGIIVSAGVGYEGTDVMSARARGIAVAHGKATNADVVADQAMALALAAIRRVPFYDALTRRGKWRDTLVNLPQMTGMRAGILGMGDIGLRIARRCAGFDMPISYYSRREVPDLPWSRAENVMALAESSDILFAAVPGGAQTRHMVNADMLRALGPSGYLVNVGRGSVVDTDAVIHALEAGLIAGVGLDVVEGEPNLPAALLSQPMAVLSPHIGGLSPHAKRNACDLLLRNLDAHFSGKPVLTPVPA